jgi:8-oxo-dGTP pyrophosphatase MutT (NUDIX family)
MISFPPTDDETRFRELLEETAATIQSDIQEHVREPGDYEVAIRESPGTIGGFVGLVYFGDYGHWWFAFDPGEDTGVQQIVPSEADLSRFRPTYDLER